MDVIFVAKAELHVSDVASLLGCSSMKVYGLIKKGYLSAHKEGKAIKIPASSVQEYIDICERRQHRGK